MKTMEGCCIRTNEDSIMKPIKQSLKKDRRGRGGMEIQNYDGGGELVQDTLYTYTELLQ
jgi:hypothetical protein